MLAEMSAVEYVEWLAHIDLLAMEAEEARQR